MDTHYNFNVLICIICNSFLSYLSFVNPHLLDSSEKQGTLCDRQRQPHYHVSQKTVRVGGLMHIKQMGLTCTCGTA